MQNVSVVFLCQLLAVVERWFLPGGAPARLQLAALAAVLANGLLGVATLAERLEVAPLVGASLYQRYDVINLGGRLVTWLFLGSYA